MEMKCKRVPDDQDYINFLGMDIYIRRYLRWKERMMPQIESIVHDLETMTPEELMKSRDMTPFDIALLVRLKYLTAEEVEKFDLRRIEQMVNRNA